jgi:hypothetical protein
MAVHFGRVTQRVRANLPVVVSLLAAGCMAAPQPYALTQPYNEADFTPYAGVGLATLDGQAFMKTVGGDVKTCAGNKVYLVPATAYSDEVIAHSHRGAPPIANRDARATQFSRTAICDATGKFTFAQVPAKRWYVVATVTWGVATENGINPQGGEVLKTVDLKSGQNQIIMTDDDRI